MVAKEGADVLNFDILTDCSGFVQWDVANTDFKNKERRRGKIHFFVPFRKEMFIHFFFIQESRNIRQYYLHCSCMMMMMWQAVPSFPIGFMEFGS